MKILKAYQLALKSQHRYLVLMGGAGSGKSVFAAQKVISRILSEEGHKFLIIRKVASTLKNSVFSLFQQIIVEEGLSHYFTINKSDFSITCNLNGNSIIMSGLDDVEKIKSVAGITGMFIEEATELTYEDWSQLQLRIRGQHNNYVQYILCFNPIKESHWLKSKLWDIQDDQVLKIKTTYKDNFFLTKDDIYHFEERLKSNPMMYNIYALAQWGSLQTGGEMVDKFDINRHTTKTIYRPELPIHISFDFNALPHCSAGIFQIQDKQLIMIDEIGLPHPKNRTKDLAEAFKQKYNQHTSGLFIYGDPAGKANDTRTEYGQNDYTIILKELQQFKPQLRVQSKAPSVVMSTNFLNSIFNGEIENINIMIDKENRKMIDDLLYLKQDKDGGKLIEYEKHPETGTKYEKYGHMFDLLRYLLITIYGNEYAIYQTGNKPFANLRYNSTRVIKNGY